MRTVRHYADHGSPDGIPLSPELYTEAGWKAVQSAVENARWEGLGMLWLMGMGQDLEPQNHVNPANDLPRSTKVSWF